MKKIVDKIQTVMFLVLAAGLPILVVLDEQYWFEKRVGLAMVAVILLALWAARAWAKGRAGIAGKAEESVGWLVLGAAMVVGAIVPAGRVANLMAPELWAGLGTIVCAIGLIRPTGPIRKYFWAVLIGLVAAGVVIGVGRGGEIWEMGEIGGQGQIALEVLRRSPIFGEFREFRVARLGILQVASGLGILGILGVLGIGYQLTLKSAKGIIKSGNLWGKLLNVLVLVFLAGFLVLPHPALTLWPLVVVAALACEASQISPMGPIGPIRRGVWAGFVGMLIVAVLGSSYGLGRVVWGEIGFREALRAANENRGIAAYYALRDTIKRNPYEVRYRLLASQIDIALANSVASQAEATESAQLTAQDQNNILILIQQAVVEGKAAIKLDPEDSLLWQNLASIYRALIGVAGGAEDWALKSYQRAIELSPKDPNPWLRMGEIHFVSGNYQGAREAFEGAVETRSDWPLAHYNLAVAFNAMGEVDRAIGELEKTLELLPEDDPSREQVEKDLGFLKGEEGSRDLKGIKEEETMKSAELKEATESAKVQPPPPPVGPEEATESAEWQEPELEEGR